MSGQKEKKKEYESPLTVKTQVEMEEGFMSHSKQKVVKDDENATVTIEKHTDSGSFEMEGWND